MRKQGEQGVSEGYVILGFRVPTTILYVRGLTNSVEARGKGKQGGSEGSKEGARGVRDMLY